MGRLAAGPSLSYELEREMQCPPGRNRRCSSLPATGDPPVEVVDPPCHGRRGPLDGVALVEPSDPEIVTKNVPRAALGPTVATLGLACLAFVLVVWNALLVYVLLNGLPQNDFCRMYYTARAFWQGEDMYGWNPATPARLNDDVVIDLWNMNPPHFHLVLLPIAVLPREAALAFWWAINVLCLGAASRWIVRELGIEPTPRVRQLGLLVLLAFTGTNTMILTSQLALLLLVPVTLAWIWARRGEWARSGLALGMLISVKPFFLLLVPYLLLRRRWSALLGCAGAFVLCFGLGVLVFGIANYQSWRQCLQLADSWAWLPMNASLLGAISRTFSETAYFTEAALWSPWTIQLTFLALASLIALVTLVTTAGDSSSAEVDRSFALLLVTSILLCPLGWVYYFWLPLGPIVAVLTHWKRHGSPGDGRARWGRVVFWTAFAGIFWPIQCNELGQYSVWATVAVANLYFWTILGIWLGLVLQGRAATGSRAAENWAI
jgi:hypothetical protein